MDLPQEFTIRTKEILGEEWMSFEDALMDTSPTSIRLNMNKSNKNIELENVKWCDHGYYLEERPQFTFDPLIHAGAYYVQEASSMFVEHAIKQLVKGDIKSLDLCAAPGGKSTLISSLLSRNSLLVSNEIIRSRSFILSENLMKWGNSNHVVTNNKSDDFGKLKHFFDLILIDAPCSGEGMFRKDPQSINEWSLANVKLCANRQREIIDNIWNSLKPGGYLLYSTCTYNREENEEIVEWICSKYEAEVVNLKINKEWGITESLVNENPTYHFYPHKIKGEGFYFAALRKSDNEEIDRSIFKPSKGKRNNQTVSFIAESENYLENHENFIFFAEGDMSYAFPASLYSDLLILQKHLQIISKGICLGQTKGKDLIPHQSLALSRYLNLDYFEYQEVDWRTAISFLRKESLVLTDVTPKGYVLLKYKDTPIGFVKNLGNRANNLYPNEWRIRSANIPEKEVVVIEK